MPRESGLWQRKGRPGWWSTINGRQVYLAADRKAAAAKLRLLLAGSASAGSTHFSVVDICDLFIEHKSSRVASSTLDWYRRHLQSLCAMYGQLPAMDLRPIHVSRWIDSHSWSQSTRSGAVTAAKAAFAWAARSACTPTNPISGTDKPAIQPRPLPISRSQVRMIIDSASDQRWRDLIVVLMETGCRPGEAARITAGDIHGDQLILRSHKTSSRGRRRIIYLTPTAIEICLRCARDYPQGPIFRNQRGNPWTRNAMAQRFARIRKKLSLGPEVTAYGFRHRFVTDSLASGVSAAVTAELVGHTSTAMIERHYSHLGDHAEILRVALGKAKSAPPFEPAQSDTSPRTQPDHPEKSG